MAAVTALASLAQGNQPSAAFSQALGASVLQQAAAALLPLGQNNVSLAAGMQLLQQVSLGRPLCFMADVDAAGLVNTSAAGGSSGSSQWQQQTGVGGLFDDCEGNEDQVLAGFMQKVGEAVEQLL